jgi:hypothetical protein
MTITAAVLAQMATLGLTREQAEGVASMLAAVETATRADCDAVAEVSRAKARDRVQRWRDRNVTKRNETSRNGLRERVTPVEEKTSNLEIEPQGKKEEEALTREALEAYSSMALSSGLAVPRVVTAARRSRVQAVIREHGLPALLEAIAKVGGSSFCRGENERGWKADLDFILQAKSFPKILEGHYDNRQPTVRAGPSARPVDDLIGSILTRMEYADANATTEIEGHSQALGRLPSH